jgi:DNA-binding transcriptional ArsR family regulator
VQTLKTILIQQSTGSLELTDKLNGISKEQFDELLKSIKNIESKLDTLVSFQRLSTPKTTTGDEQKKILNLCDRKHNINEIAEATGKKIGTIKPTLKTLRDKGLIKSVRVGKKTVYERIR